MKCEQCGETFPSEYYFSPRKETGGRAICMKCFANATDEDKTRWLEPQVEQTEPTVATPDQISPRSPGWSIVFFVVWLVFGFLACTFLVSFSLSFALSGGAGPIAGLALALGGLFLFVNTARTRWRAGDKVSAAGFVVGLSLPFLLVGACFLFLAK